MQEGDVCGDEGEDRRGVLVYDTAWEDCPTARPEAEERCNHSSLSLVFNSHFESGNLKQAYRTSDRVYTLFLTPDAGSQDFTQWYYFSASNTSPLEVTFRITNFVKDQSLYTEGMRPLVRSKRRELSGGESWLREGDSISYVRSGEVRRKSGESGEPLYFYELTFTYLFKFWHDTVYFAYSLPYTYSDLRKYVDRVGALTEIVEVGTLCVTPEGTEVPRLTITSHISTYRSSPCLPPHHLKKLIILTARVHPGESVSSLIIQGALDFLISDSKDAVSLRSAFVFEVIPMLNPDGVKHGYYRCGPEGVDLNRVWNRPNKTQSGTVFHAKELIEREKALKEVLLFVDIHGHSRKKSAFLYGCDTIAINHIEKRRNIATKMIPLLMQSLEPCFAFNSCTFVVTKDKETTARVVCYRELGVLLSFTMENSFFSSRKATNEQLATSDYSRIGENLCRTLLPFIHEKGFLQLFVSTLAVISKSKRSTEDFSVNATFSKSFSTSFISDEECIQVSLPSESRGTSLWSFESTINLQREAWDSLVKRYELLEAEEPDPVISVDKDPKRDTKKPVRRTTKVIATTRLERVLEITPKPQTPYFKLPARMKLPRTPKIPVRMTTIELVKHEGAGKGKLNATVPLRESKQKYELGNRNSGMQGKGEGDVGNTLSGKTLRKSEMTLPDIRASGGQRQDAPPRLFQTEDKSDARSRSTRPDIRNYWDLLLDRDRIDPLSYLSHIQEGLVSALPMRDYNSLLPGINTSRVAERPIDLAKLMAESTRLRVRKELAMKAKGGKQGSCK